MKLLFFTSDRQPGGMLRALDAYLAALCEDDAHEVHVLCPPDGAFQPMALARLDRRRVHACGPLTRLALRRLTAIGRPGLPRDFDLALIHNGFAAPALAHHAGAVVGVCHNDKPRQFAGVDGLICLSRAAHQAAGTATALPLHCLPHFYTPAVTTAKAVNRDGPLTVGWAGRFVDKKNLACFLRAAALVRRRHPETRFVVAGDGALRDQARRQAAEWAPFVDFRGWVEIADFAAALDLFCLTSREEPFGYVLLEMMDRGVACLASACHGPRDILEDGAVAPLHAVDDAAALAAQICAMIKDREMLARVQNACFQRARAPFFARDRFNDGLRAVLARHAG
ncbi:MAG: glycosyltransferase [Thalassobaculaceae bacterium]